MSTWEEIGEKWNRAQQMGWQAVQAALDVGDDLVAKKAETPRGEWISHLTSVSDLKPAAANQWAYRLMRLAQNRNLIEQATPRPETRKDALALLPKGPARPKAPAKAKAKPTVTSDPAPSAKALTRAREEVIDLEEFAKKTARDQAAILTRKQVKVELARMKAEADAEVQEALRAVQSAYAKKESELEKERMRVSALQNEAREKIRCYEDLINKRFNGHDPLQKLKILRQAVHPDRQETSTELRTKAMLAIDHIAQCLGFAV